MCVCVHVCGGGGGGGGGVVYSDIACVCTVTNNNYNCFYSGALQYTKVPRFLTYCLNILVNYAVYRVEEGVAEHLTLNTCNYPTRYAPILTLCTRYLEGFLRLRMEYLLNSPLQCATATRSTRPPTVGIAEHPKVMRNT